MTDNGSNGATTVMPVQPMGYGGYGGGWGNGFGFGGDASWLIILFLFAAMGGGFGGWGGGFGGGWGFGNDITFPWLLNGQNQINANTNSGFDHAATQSALGNLSTAITSGFGDVQLGIAGVNQNICQTGNGITAAVSNGFAQAEVANNARQIANMQQAFNSQTATTAAINGVQNQLSKCCCDQASGIESLRYTVATENCADRAAVSDGIRDVLTATTANTQRILDKLCDQELAAAQRENQELRTRLNMADLAASQAAQTAALVADNTAQTQYIVNRVAPYPVPAYPAYTYGFGFNNGWGWNNNGCCGNNGFGFNG